MPTYSVEYTDTFNGDANYAWVKRAKVTMPELTYYGYGRNQDGSTNYTKANKSYQRELMRRAKAAVGLTGVRGARTDLGDTIEFRPYGSATVLFIS
jgi:hypothetical protein